jgi:hypothetical protein
MTILHRRSHIPLYVIVMYAKIKMDADAVAVKTKEYVKMILTFAWMVWKSVWRSVVKK